MTPVRVFKGGHGFVYVEYCPQKNPGRVIVTVMTINSVKFVHRTRTPFAYQTEYMEELQEL